MHWGGDPESTFEAMAETLRGGLSLTLSGFAFTTHDIGGFEVGNVIIFECMSQDLSYLRTGNTAASHIHEVASVRPLLVALTVTWV